MQTDFELLYEDNHIIVVVKPNNILSQSDNTNDIDMLTLIKNYLKEKYHKPGNVYLGLVHRLDRPVSGVMVFAKTSKAASRLSTQVQKHLLKKEYMAVVHDDGTLKDEGEFIDYIAKDADNNSFITDEEHGKYAELYYKVVERNKLLNLTLVSIDLKTGRHHQIRIQFSSRHFPLYGDQRYGLQDKKQIALHAYKLEFSHPISGEKMIFISKPSQNDIWINFKI